MKKEEISDVKKYKRRDKRKKKEAEGAVKEKKMNAVAGAKDQAEKAEK